MAHDPARLAATRTAAAAGLSLVRGPLLADERDPWWAASESAAAEHAVRRLRHVVLAATMSVHEWPAAEQQARDLMAADPFDEVALRAQMTAMARSGRGASALAAYAEFRQLLADELGVSPDDETEALHLHLLQGTLPGPPTAPVPAPPALLRLLPFPDESEPSAGSMRSPTSRHTVAPCSASSRVRREPARRPCSGPGSTRAVAAVQRASPW